MKLATRDGNGWLEEQIFRWFRLRKRVRQFLKYRRGMEKDVLFIVGAQRSGTSMIHHLFRLDWDAVTYDEWSSLSVLDGKEPLRWRPLSEVAARIRSDRAPFVVCKPLVEAQRLGELLDTIPSSKAVWVYRDYRDVASSSLKYFGEQIGILDLAPILTDETDDWRTQNLDDADRKTVLDLFDDDLPGPDAAALFWHVRNSLYFSQGLDHDPRVVVCRYEDLVTDPSRVMAAAYGFLDRPYPGDRIVADVVGGSKGKGRSLELTGQVDDLCRDMLRRLNAEPRLGYDPS